MTYRKDIDALRGFAVLVVTLYHLFPSLMPSGFVGVDIFFVISGYLITAILLKQNEQGTYSLLTFYDKRIRRIFPALITIFVFCLVFGYLFLYSEEYLSLAKHIVQSTIFLQNYNLISEVGYFDTASHLKPLLHLWSLSVEEQFYIVFPILVYLWYRFKINISLSFAILIAISLGLCIGEFHQDASQTYYHIITRLWQLVAGALIASQQQRGKWQYSNHKYLLIVSLGLMLYAVYGLDTNLYPYYYAVFPTLGAVLFILAKTDYRHYLGLDKIGLISYPLYLWHWVWYVFFRIYIGNSLGLNMSLVVVGLSLSSAYFTYQYIERIRYTKYRYISLLLLGAMVSIGILSQIIYQNKGLPQRSHISGERYLQEFKRAQRTDPQIEAYLKAHLKEEPLFAYKRGYHLDRDSIIAIIGDSHAHVLWDGVVALANKHDYGVMLLASSSCPTLLGFKEGNNPKMITQCEQQKEQIMYLLANDKRIHKVVIATRGPTYIHGDVKGAMTIDNIDKQSKQVYKHAKTRYSNPKNIYHDYFQGYNNTLVYLKSISHIKNIYYLLENPELDFEPKNAIPRPFDYLGLSSQTRGVLREAYLYRMKPYRNSMRSISLEYNVEILDPLELLCPTKDCIYFKDGNFLYADDDHYSIHGSVYVMKYFESIIFANK